MRSKAAIQASKAAFAEARPNYVGPDGRCVRAGNGTVNNAERPAYFVWAPAPATAPPPPTPEWPSAQPPRSVGKKRPPPAAVELLEDHVRSLLLAPPPLHLEEVVVHAPDADERAQSCDGINTMELSFFSPQGIFIED